MQRGRTHQTRTAVKRVLRCYLGSWWLAAAFCLLAIFLLVAFHETTAWLSNGLAWLALLAWFGVLVAGGYNLFRKRWKLVLAQALGFGLCAVAGYVAIIVMLFSVMFGPSEDGFADGLTIPPGLELSEPDKPTTDSWEPDASKASADDELQRMVREALAVSGTNTSSLSPALPSLRKEVRRWSYAGEPRDTLNGYVSEFGGAEQFQTRCLLCLDAKPWGPYAVQHVSEGSAPIEPKLETGNGLLESRIMIECDSLWVELFEQSGQPERRVTKATIAALEKEFAEFGRDPDAAIARARARSAALAQRLVGSDGHPFRLVEGMQPGIYEVIYALNPGEPGSVYLKAFEVTRGTPLSVDRLPDASQARLGWSANAGEKFAAKAGFTIYEGDWGKPYAARFEVWFVPASGNPERLLAQRVFKIEGWQR